MASTSFHTYEFPWHRHVAALGKGPLLRLRRLGTVSPRRSGDGPRLVRVSRRRQLCEPLVTLRELEHRVLEPRLGHDGSTAAGLLSAVTPHLRLLVSVWHLWFPPAPWR